MLTKKYTSDHFCVKVMLMEWFKSLRWILLLVVLVGETDSVIGHVSDGSSSQPLSPGGVSDRNSLFLEKIVEVVTPISPISPISLGGTLDNNNSGKLSGPQGPPQSPAEDEESILIRKNMPYLDKEASKNVTTVVGQSVNLNCRVKNLQDKTVSWVRHRDIHLLTVGRYTYTTDQRFRAIHHPTSEDYTLMIRYPQLRDSGIYECQVSTTPHISHFVHLSVVEPLTMVLGGPDLFIDRGSTINLTCTVRYSPEPPNYIIWNHNDNIISYNSLRGGVSVLTEKGEVTTSYLLIQSARPTDSGRYSCNPSNAQLHSINVHVLNGEKPEAMQTGGQIRQIPISFCLLTSIILVFVTS